MIITTSRSRVGLVLDVLLTVVGWAGFLYLFSAGVMAILRGAAHGPQAPWLLPFLPTLGTLSTYAFIAAFNAAILIAWAIYNHRRFAGLDRRKPIAPVGSSQLARTFSLATEQVRALAAAKTATIRHDSQGGIVSLSGRGAL